MQRDIQYVGLLISSMQLLYSGNIQFAQQFKTIAEKSSKADDRRGYKTHGIHMRSAAHHLDCCL